MEQVKIYSDCIRDKYNTVIEPYDGMVINTATVYGNAKFLGYMKKKKIIIKNLSCSYYLQLLRVSECSHIMCCDLKISGYNNIKNKSDFVDAQKLAQTKNIQLRILFQTTFFPEANLFTNPKIWYVTEYLTDEEINTVLKHSEYFEFPMSKPCIHPGLFEILCSEEYANKFTKLSVYDENSTIDIKKLLANQSRISQLIYRCHNHDDAKEIMGFIGGISQVSIEIYPIDYKHCVLLDISSLLKDESVTSINTNWPFCFDDNILNNNYNLTSFTASSFHINKHFNMIKDAYEKIMAKVKENNEICHKKRFATVKVAVPN